MAAGVQLAVAVGGASSLGRVPHVEHHFQRLEHLFDKKGLPAWEQLGHMLVVVCRTTKSIGTRLCSASRRSGRCDCARSSETPVQAVAC